MARIELSNIGGGGGTTLSLTTTGTSGAATLAGSVLNIPVYQGQLTLTTTGTSGAATLSGDVLNIPQYSGGGGTPAGSAGQVQFNSTPAGSFAASANLVWDNSNVRLNIGAPSSPTGRLNVKGGGSTSATINTRLTNSGNTEILKVSDDGELTVYKPLSAAGRIATFYGYQAPFTFEASIEVGMQSANDGIAVFGGSNVGTNTGGFLQTKSATSRAISFNSLGAVSIATSQISSSTYSALNVGISSNIGSNVPTSDGVQFRLINGTMTHTGTSAVQQFLSLASFKPSTINRSLINTTYTNATNLYIDGPPVNGSGVTFTNTYSIYVNSGQSYFGGNIGAGVSLASARLHVRGSNTSGGTNALLVQNSTPDDIYKIENDGKISYLATNTAAGTTGAQTINRPSGTVNFAAGATSLVVTNSLCTTASIVLPVIRTNDATATIKNVVPAAGSFTINLGAAGTAETSVGFFIIN
jgi:hypothetical protein